jgi:N,N'-diacetyl-8-epilegionaminate cytidylyltransferase
LAIAFIHARGGSKRCPKKNIRKIAGMPLIAHTIRQAQRHPLIDKVVVSTDDQDIADIALYYGAALLMRPAHLCTDDAPEFDSWKYAVEHFEMDYFVNLPCTCPLRSDEDISRTIMFVELGAKIAFTVKKSRDFPLPPDQSEWSVVGSCYVITPKFIRTHLSIFDGDEFTTVIVPDERAIDIDTEYDFKVAKLLMENP